MKNSIRNNILTIYRQYAQEFDEQIAGLELYNEAYDYLLTLLRPKDALLDLGCGPGNISHYLLQFQPTLEVTSVDQSPEMIELARNKLGQGAFLVGDICELSLDSVFDCVACGFAIPYMTLPLVRKTAQVMNRSLKQRGVFYISFMEGQNEGFEKTSFTGNDELYIYYHSRDTVIEILAENGLSLLSTFEVDYQEPDGSITQEVVMIGRKR